MAQVVDDVRNAVNKSLELQLNYNIGLSTYVGFSVICVVGGLGAALGYKLFDKYYSRRPGT